MAKNGSRLKYKNSSNAKERRKRVIERFEKKATLDSREQKELQTLKERI